MPIIKSAKKRVKTSEKATIRNARTRRTVREAVKAFQKALTTGKASDIDASHKSAVSAIDTAAKKNVIHKNKAARKKSQLSAAAKAAGAKPAPATKKASKPVTKTAPKKAVTTKKVAPKTTAKKAAPKVAPKKPATKK